MSLKKKLVIAGAITAGVLAGSAIALFRKFKFEIVTEDTTPDDEK